MVASIFTSKHDRKLEIWFPNGCRLPLVARFVLKSSLQHSSHFNALSIPCFRFEIEICLMKIELEMRSWFPRFSLSRIMNRMTEINTGCISYLPAYRRISNSTLTCIIPSPLFLTCLSCTAWITKSLRMHSCIQCFTGI